MPYLPRAWERATYAPNGESAPVGGLVRSTRMQSMVWPCALWVKGNWVHFTERLQTVNDFIWGKMGTVPLGKPCMHIGDTFSGKKSIAKGGKCNSCVVITVSCTLSLGSRTMSVTIPHDPFARPASGAMFARTISFMPMAISILWGRLLLWSILRCTIAKHSGIERLWLLHLSTA